MSCICEPGQIKERNGHSASCNRYNRKLETDSRKEANKKASQKAVKKSIAKVGTKNTFACSDGTRVNQVYVNKMRDLCYVLMDTTDPKLYCEGCEIITTQGHAHIIPQAHCKTIRKTDLIWNPENIFRACNNCNAAIENPNGTAWTKLKNIQKCLQFIMENDPTLFVKFQLKAQEIGFSIKQVEEHKI